jgi:hypothetical protein
MPTFRRRLGRSQAPLIKELNDAEYHEIARLYDSADPRFVKWVDNNKDDEDRMEQMELILKRNSHTQRADQTNSDYTNQYINRGLFDQIDFHGGYRMRRKRSSHKKRSSRKKRSSHKKRY